jgi:hypothetical protein
VTSRVVAAMTLTVIPYRLTAGAGSWAAGLILAALGTVCFLGCSRSSPYDLVAVSGKVTYEDGSLIPADSIMLKFNPEAAPLDAKTHPRMGIAMVNVSDGSFEFATTHKHADGLVAGKHKVLVVAYGKDGQADEVVPQEYRHPATTPVEIDTDKLPFDIKVRKPKVRG